MVNSIQNSSVTKTIELVNIISIASLQLFNSHVLRNNYVHDTMLEFVLILPSCEKGFKQL